MTTDAQPARRPYRLLVVLAIGGLLIAGALAYIYFHFYFPVGEGPAGEVVASEPFQEVWSERKVLVLGIGDSVTAGFGVRRDLGYVARVVDNPTDEFDDMRGLCLRRVLPNLSVENIAISGSNSIDHVDQIERFPTQPDDVFGLVVMTSGGNDLIHWYGQRPPKEGAMYGATLEEAEPWIANYDARLNENLDRIGEKFPGGCVIFLADIYDPSDGVGDAPTMGLPPWPDGLKILTRYNEILRDAAAERENVVHVPMHATFLGHGFHCTNFWNAHYCADDPHYWYGGNLEDPNERGYDALRRTFLNTIARERGRFTVAE